MLSRRSEDLLKNAVKKYLSFFGYVRVSPNKLQRELNLSRRRLCGGDQSGAGDGISSLIEDSEVSSLDLQDGPAARLNVSSSQSMAFLPSNVTVK
jgi:hypothetical protein